jgi:hypothetical protein
MRISHRELETCRSNPKRWYREARTPGRRGPPPGYNGLLKLGIVRYHKTADSFAARRHLAQLYTNAAHRLKNVSNVERCLEHFDQYVRTLTDDHTVVADARVRIDLSGAGFLELTGEIHRVDIIDTGTRAILLGDYPDDWRTQLRFPLIQRAIARHYAVPEREVSVGVQRLDGSGLQTARFTKAQIDTAVIEFTTIGDSIAR